MIAHRNRMDDGLAMMRFITQIHINNNSQFGGMFRHITIFASHYTTQNDRRILPVRHSVNILNSIGVGLQNWRPESPIARGDTRTGVHESTNTRAHLFRSVKLAKSQDNKGQLIVDLGW